MDTNKSMRCIILIMLCAGALLGISKTAQASQKIIQFRISGEPATLDWSLARSSFETPILMNVMEGLVAHNKDLKPEPRLAEKWEVSSDAKTYTFTLRSGVNWSDGKPLRAQDFVDSWMRLLAPDTQAPYWDYLAEIEGATEYHSKKIAASKVGVKAEGDLKLVVKLKQPVPHFLHLLSFWVTFPVRLDLISKFKKSWSEPGHLVTLGPYLLSEWQKGRSLTLKKNSKYFNLGTLNDSPEQVTVRVVKSDSEARESFKKQEIDFLLDAKTGDVVATRAMGAKILQFPYLATYYLGFNARSQSLQSVSIRKALTAAVDRESISSVLKGGQTPAHGFIPPGISGARLEKGTTVSLYEARQTLAKLGFADGKGFGKLTLWVESFDGSDEFGKWLVANFKEKLGIEVDLKRGSAAEFDRSIKDGKTDLFVTHWGADYPDASNFLNVFTSQAGTNRVGWKNTEYDELMNVASEMINESDRLKNYNLAEDLLVTKESVVFPLFYKKNTALLGPKVQTLEISPLNYFFFSSIR